MGNKSFSYVLLFIIILFSSFVNADLKINNTVYLSFNDNNLTDGDPDDLSGNDNNGTTQGDPTTGHTCILG